MTLNELDEEYANNRIIEARSNIQQFLTSLFLAENNYRTRSQPDLDKANKIFHLRVEISKQVHTALGEPSCIQPHNQLLG